MWSRTRLLILLAILGGCAHDPDPRQYTEIISNAEYSQVQTNAVQLLNPVVDKYLRWETLTDEDMATTRQALKMFRGLMAYDAAQPSNYLLIGESHELLGEHDQAILYLRLGLKALKPGSEKNADMRQIIAEMLYFTSLACLSKGDYSQGVKAAQAAVELFPTAAAYHEAEALNWNQLKNDDQAAMAAHKALELDPERRRARQVLTLMGRK